MDKEWLTDINTAKELFYPDSVVKALKLEPNQRKRSHILANARKQEIRKDLNKHGKDNRKRSADN